jgi:hypothetical protein
MDWYIEAQKLRCEGLSYNKIADMLNVPLKTVQSRFKRDELRGKNKIVYEDKKEYNETDIDCFFEKMIELQEAQDKLDTKQVKANIRIDDDKPIAVAYWSDWHIGGKGTDYKAFQQDLELIRDTEGLYFIGGGDYKDNYISGTHVGGNFEQIIQPGMQDIVVMRQMEKVANKCLALVRGCHDSWDKKQGDKDFLATLCEITNSVNMWHGGEITIKLGKEDYLWRVRHKYTNKSSMNFENSMRRLIETQGPCDVAAEAHLHNEYSMCRHINGRYSILLRGGSYKIWDEHSQQMAGYKGKEGVPVVIMYPNEHRTINLDTLEDAIVHLKAARS